MWRYFYSALHSMYYIYVLKAISLYETVHDGTCFGTHDVVVAEDVSAYGDVHVRGLAGSQPRIHRLSSRVGAVALPSPFPTLLTT